MMSTCAMGSDFARLIDEAAQSGNPFFTILYIMGN